MPRREMRMKEAQSRRLLAENCPRSNEQKSRENGPRINNKRALSRFR
jgi:hypothetical protein